MSRTKRLIPASLQPTTRRPWRCEPVFLTALAQWWVPPAYLGVAVLSASQHSRHRSSVHQQPPSSSTQYVLGTLALVCPHICGAGNQRPRLCHKINFTVVLCVIAGHRAPCSARRPMGGGICEMGKGWGSGGGNSGVERRAADTNREQREAGRLKGRKPGSVSRLELCFLNGIRRRVVGSDWHHGDQGSTSYRLFPPWQA